MQPWALGGGPDCETMTRLVEEEKHSDSEIAELYGVRRQTVTYWRLKCGMTRPGDGHGPRRRRRDRLSHKDLIWWQVRQEDMNHPIRKRLVEVSLRRQGAQMSADAIGRVDDFLAFLEAEQVVVCYDPNHLDGRGERAPFYFVPRDPAVDADGDIVRR